LINNQTFPSSYQEREFQEKWLKQEGEFRAKELDLQMKRD